MYTQAEKEKQKLLYLITSLGLGFSGVFRHIVHNAFYKSSLPSQSSFSGYFFLMAEGLVYILIPIALIYFYNSGCKDEFKRCKIPASYIFYDTGINAVSSLAVNAIICIVFFVLSFSGHHGRKLTGYDSGNVIPAFSFFPQILLEIVINCLFWRTYFKKYEKKNIASESLAEAKLCGTAKDASVRALLVTIFTVAGYNIFLTLQAILCNPIARKLTMSTDYTEFVLYSRLLSFGRSTFALVGIVIGILVYNLICKNRKEYKVPILGITYTLIAISCSNVIVNLSDGIYSLISNAFPEIYNVIKATAIGSMLYAIPSALGLISLFALSMLIWVAWFKNTLNVQKAVKTPLPNESTNQYAAQNSVQNCAPAYTQYQQSALAASPENARSNKSRGVAAVLCFFFGTLGIHRFYVGKIGTGLIWLFTLGFFGIGDIVDFIMIICGSFKDSEGKKL